MRVAPLTSVISLMLAQLPALAAVKEGPGEEGVSAVSHLIDQYNVVWTTPSKHAGESMPVGGKIRLLPAWPVDWDVDFKLHAPGRTVVEGKLRSGRMTSLNVTPKERQEDVIRMKESQ